LLLGWWLCKSTTSGSQGWTPSAYVEEIEQQARAPPPPPPPVAPARPTPALAATPLTNGTERRPSPAPAVRAKPTPPAPPVKRPVAGARKALPPPTPARDSAVSLGGDSLRLSSGTDSGRATPNGIGSGSLAGGLAEALRARQNAMAGTSKEDEDDW
jgi:myosin I